MTSNNTVCIYIPTHNRSGSLKKSIESAQQQTYKAIEIHICDDNSTDDTEKLVKKMQADDPRIFYHKLLSNSGACAARNAAIYNTNAKFITGLDDDDEFTEKRIEFFMHNWKDEYSFICTNFINKYSHNNKCIKNYSGKTKIFKPQDLLSKNEASNQVFTTTKKLRDVGGFNTSVKRLQDWDTWIKLSQKHGNFLRLGDCLYIMNHYIQKSNARVSRSITYQEALRELLLRHAALYEKNVSHKCTIQSEIYYCENVTSIFNYLALCKQGKKLTPAFKFLKLFMKNIAKKLNFKEINVTNEI